MARMHSRLLRAGGVPLARWSVTTGVWARLGAWGLGQVTVKSDEDASNFDDYDDDDGPDAGAAYAHPHARTRTRTHHAPAHPAQ
jgi:hypothetical protein